MSPSKYLDIIKKIPDSIFLASNAAQLGITRYELKKLLEEEVLEKLCHGVYRVAGSDTTDEDVFKAAALRVGEPSAICLLSALAHYGLSDTIPRKTWIMVPASKRTRYADLKVLRTRQPKWRVGIQKRNGYRITSIERSIVDCLTLRSKLGVQLGMEALKRSLRQRGTTLGKIVEVSKALGVLHRIQPYVEALA